MIDPRPAAIARRLAPIRRILPFASAKGGVGKTVCSALTALALRKAGLRAGLLDLDFQGATAHLALGAELRFPEERGGIRPLRARGGLDFVSFAAFSRERAVPLRGPEVSEALLELLAVTVWDPLDFLVVDMPPGIGDELLDVLRLLPKAEFVVVATPSAFALNVVERLLSLLGEMRLPVLGLIENMARARQDAGVAQLADRHRLPLLGAIPYLPDIEELLSAKDPLAGPLGEPMRRVADRLTGKIPAVGIG
jgi:ATP-binding protein involved in chromosome partitioning